MKMGLEAAFAEINKAGGVKGRKLELKSVDDGYEPTKSIEAVKKLLETTRCSRSPARSARRLGRHPADRDRGRRALHRRLHRRRILREPHKPLVMNIRASYFQETEAMVEHLTKDLGATKIAIMYQDDAFGQAGLPASRRRSTSGRWELAGEGTFERNTRSPSKPRCWRSRRPNRRRSS
jgi:ABC-type branched-subunit amino acid transport system substrate-binding protein